MGANTEQMTPGFAAKNWRWICAASTPSDMPQEFEGQFSSAVRPSSQAEKRRRLGYRLRSRTRDRPGSDGAPP
jgi:hypothetical protein